jgi:thiamine kinase-like enzyme
MTADAVCVYLVNDGATSVLQVSSPAFPDVVRESAQKIEVAREVLGGELGSFIPAPLDQWRVNGVSCALFEEFTPIARGRLLRFIQFGKIRSPVLAWLHQIAAIDRGPAKEAERCLQALAQCPYENLRAPAIRALERIRSGFFAPRARVMHGDLTLGNILLDSSKRREFVIIDWRGSDVDGYPIFDLVKFAEALGIGPKALRAELSEHAKTLACEIEDTRSYLVMALGYIWLNLDQFPPERFAAMAKSNLKTLDAALHG